MVHHPKFGSAKQQSFYPAHRLWVRRLDRALQNWFVSAPGCLRPKLGDWSRWGDCVCGAWARMTGMVGSGRATDWNTCKGPLNVAWASWQHGFCVLRGGIPRGSIWKEDIPREPGKAACLLRLSHRSQKSHSHHFCHILLVRSATSPLIFKERGHRFFPSPPSPWEECKGIGDFFFKIATVIWI